MRAKGKTGSAAGAASWAALPNPAALPTTPQDSPRPRAARVRQSLPRKGCTYCSAMSQGKKIQVSWLTSVM